VEAPEVARQLIATPKLMITIFWDVSGIHVIDYLPPGTSFDSTYFIDNILYDFNTLPIISVAVRQKKLFVIHMDNSSIHKSKSVIAKTSSIPVQLAPHPQYSPDLTPSNFFLFGHLKSQMIGREFNSPEDLIRWIRAAFLRISRDTSERVFDEWIDRVERCISHEGSYFPEE
jgi:transposase